MKKIVVALLAVLLIAGVSFAVTKGVKNKKSKKECTKYAKKKNCNPEDCKKEATASYYDCPLSKEKETETTP